MSLNGHSVSPKFKTSLATLCKPQDSQSMLLLFHLDAKGPGPSLHTWECSGTLPGARGALCTMQVRVGRAGVVVGGVCDAPALYCGIVGGSLQPRRLTQTQAIHIPSALPLSPEQSRRRQHLLDEFQAMPNDSGILFSPAISSSYDYSVTQQRWGRVTTQLRLRRWKA